MFFRGSMLGWLTCVFLLCVGGVLCLPIFSFVTASEEVIQVPVTTQLPATAFSDLLTGEELSPEPTPTPEIVPEIPQMSTDLTVSPATLILHTLPGQPVTAEIKVLNNSLEREYLEIQLQKFGPNETGQSPIIVDFEENDDYRSWMRFDTQKFVAEPGIWKSITVTFTPPRDASLSYYYAIVVRRQLELEGEEVSAVFAGAPAILVLSSVESPNIKRELQLVSFKTKRKFYEFLPVEFELKIKNTGNIHLSPYGTIFIDSEREKDIALLSFNKANGMVLPDSIREYTAAWDDGFPVYTPEQTNGELRRNEVGDIIYTLEWDFSRSINTFRFGKYTAHLLMVYDNGVRDVPIESTITFWVIPWRMIFTVVGFVVLMLVPYYALSRRSKKNK